MRVHATSRRRPAGLAAAVVTVSIALAGCGGTGGPVPGTASPGTQPPSSSLVTGSPGPAATSIVAAGAQTIRTQNGSADWLAIAGGTVWGAGIEDGIGRWDAATGSFVGSTKAPDQCGAMDVGFGSVWSAGCDDAHPRIIRIDPVTAVARFIDLPEAPPDSETSIGVGEGGAWLIIGKDQRQLVRIDPATNRIAATYPVPGTPSAVRAGGGAIWVSDPDRSAVHRVDPKTGAIAATIATGSAPRFIAFGAGALWTLDQDAGSVSKIDPATNTVSATIDIGAPVEGGDIAVGGGFVWARGNPTLLVKIDPKTDTVVAVYGPPSGSGSVAADDAAVWVSAHDIDTIWRLPLR